MITSRVVVADRAAVVRAGLRSLLEVAGDIEVLGCAADEAGVLNLVERRAPDVALIGTELDGSPGTDVIRQLRRIAPQVRCIAVSHVADDALFFRAVVAGAVGFLIEDLDAHELVAAVRTVAAGHSLIDASAIDALRGRMARSTIDRGLPRSLTGQEQRIAMLVIQGVTNAEIASELGLAEKTVRNYMSSILAKSGTRNRTELTAQVIRWTAARSATG